jgi:hypothetical protein
MTRVYVQAQNALGIIDLRERVARAWDVGLNTGRIAAKYEVSRAWVYRLLQRRRDTGSLAPRAPNEIPASHADGGPGRPVGRPDHSAAERDLGGVAARAAHRCGAEHDLARVRPARPGG